MENENKETSEDKYLTLWEREFSNFIENDELTVVVVNDIGNLQELLAHAQYILYSSLRKKKFLSVILNRNVGYDNYVNRFIEMYSSKVKKLNFIIFAEDKGNTEGKNRIFPTENVEFKIFSEENRNFMNKSVSESFYDSWKDDETEKSNEVLATVRAINASSLYLKTLDTINTSFMLDHRLSDLNSMLLSLVYYKDDEKCLTDAFKELTEILTVLSYGAQFILKDENNFISELI